MRTRAALVAGPLTALALLVLVTTGTGIARQSTGGEAAGGEKFGDAADYVGSDACRSCHPDAWQAWNASAHVGTIERATPTAVAADFAGPDGAPAKVRGPTYPQPAPGPPTREVAVSLHVREDGYWALFDGTDDFIERNFAPTETGKYAFRLDYTLGKLFYQGFLTEMPSGELYVTPLMWDIREERWFLAGWRPFATSCGHCHVTGMKLQDTPVGSAGRAPQTDPPRWVQLPLEWQETNVGCEVCHGPGSAHVSDPVADTIIDPGRLPRRAQVDLCGTCHGMGVANAQTYRPGDPVDPPMTTAEVAPGQRINGFWPTGQHKTYFTVYQGFLKSPHWDRANLTCAPCHDPHSGGTRLSVEDNAQCTLCHTAYKRRLERHTRHPADSAGSRCVACHMPANNEFTLVPDVVLMRHVRSHDFTLPDPRVNLRYGVPDACSACHAQGPSWALEQVELLWGPLEERESGGSDEPLSGPAGRR